LGPNNAPVLDPISGNIGFYELTAAESALSITPVDFFWPPGYPERYGTNTVPGTTDMTTAVNNAIAVAHFTGGTVVLGSTWPYLVTSPLNCTTDSIAHSGNENGFKITNIGNQFPNQSPPYQGVIHAKHTGVAVFDCSGAFRLIFENVSVSTDTTTYPKTCWFRARNADGSSQFHNFINCYVTGSFSVAVDYNYGSEDDIWIGCRLYNYAAVNGTKVVYLTTTNNASLSSPFITIATGTQSCIDHEYLGGNFLNGFGGVAGVTTNDIFYVDGNCDSVKITSVWYKCGIQAGAGGRAFIYVDTTNAVANFWTIIGAQTEHDGSGANQQVYGIFFGTAAGTPQGWTIIGGVWDSQTNAIASGASVTLSNFFISNLSEAASHGIHVFGTIQDSQLFGLGSATIATALRCVITGQYSGGGYTITTLTKCIIHDTWTGDIISSGPTSSNGVTTPPAQLTGWGTPVGSAVINNYNITDAGGANSNTNKAVAQIILYLKNKGDFGA
jgi:hypothetical protein